MTLVSLQRHTLTRIAKGSPARAGFACWGVILVERSTYCHTRRSGLCRSTCSYRCCCTRPSSHPDSCKRPQNRFDPGPSCCCRFADLRKRSYTPSARSSTQGPARRFTRLPFYTPSPGGSLNFQSGTILPHAEGEINWKMAAHRLAGQDDNLIAEFPNSLREPGPLLRRYLTDSSYQGPSN